jgi:hypothetical protein
MKAPSLPSAYLLKLGLDKVCPVAPVEDNSCSFEKPAW